MGDGWLHVLGDASLQTEVLLRIEIGYVQGAAMTVRKLGEVHMWVSGTTILLTRCMPGATS